MKRFCYICILEHRIYGSDSCILYIFKLMTDLGYIRVGAVSPEVKPGDVGFNIDNIISMSKEAVAKSCEVIVFPELSVTGYTCADLFYQTTLLDATLKGLHDLAAASGSIDAMIVVGAPLCYGDSLFNCAVVIYKGTIFGAVPKQYLPNYNEFYERRWFADASKAATVDSRAKNNNSIPLLSDTLFSFHGATIGIEICEDLWVPVPPSSQMACAGANIILNLSATNEVIGKHQYLRDLIANQSARCRCGYVYASAGIGESSTDVTYSGNCIIAENGAILGESERFTLENKLIVRDIDIELLKNDRLKFSTFSDCATPSYSLINIDTDNGSNQKKHRNSDGSLTLLRNISAYPFIADDPLILKQRCSEISAMQTLGLVQRLRAINCRNAVIGISGGLDSTLALLVTVRAFDMLGYDRKGIMAVTMPGFGTTTRTKNNASSLMNYLGVTNISIPINKAVEQHFRDINHNPEIHDATYENSQARERTQILMDMANKTGGIVIGTGDLSELALGWCTFNGDHISMYGVNASIPKTLVIHLVKWYADSSSDPNVQSVLLDIVDTPISPELLPAAADGSIGQKTEDLVGPYELHDFFLHGMIRNNFSPRKIYILATKAFADKYSPETIKHWLRIFYRRFFSNQFKRSCMPDGVKVGSVSLSPRGDWRMPSDASAALWLEEVETL